MATHHHQNPPAPPPLALPPGRLVDVDAVLNSLPERDVARYVGWIKNPHDTWASSDGKTLLIYDVYADNGCVYSPVAMSACVSAGKLFFDSRRELIFQPQAAFATIDERYSTSRPCDARRGGKGSLERIGLSAAKNAANTLNLFLLSQQNQGLGDNEKWISLAREWNGKKEVSEGNPGDSAAAAEASDAFHKLMNFSGKLAQRHHADLYFTEKPERYRQKDYFGPHYIGGLGAVCTCGKIPIPSVSGAQMTKTGQSGQIEIRFQEKNEKFREPATWAEAFASVNEPVESKGGYGAHAVSQCKNAFCPFCAPKRQNLEVLKNFFIIMKTLLAGNSFSTAALTLAHGVDAPEQTMLMLRQLWTFITEQGAYKRYVKKNKFHVVIRYFETTHDNLMYLFTGGRDDSPSGMHPHFHFGIECAHDVTEKDVKDFEAMVQKLALRFFEINYPKIYRRKKKALKEHCFKAKLYAEEPEDNEPERGDKRVKEAADFINQNLDSKEVKRAKVIDMARNFIRQIQDSSKEIEEDLKMEVPAEMLRYFDDLPRIWADRAGDDHLAKQLAGALNFSKYCATDYRGAVAHELAASVSKGGKLDRRVSFPAFALQAARLNHPIINDYFWHVRKSLVGIRTYYRARGWNYEVRGKSTGFHAPYITEGEYHAELNARKTLPPLDIKGNTYNLDAFCASDPEWRKMTEVDQRSFMYGLNKEFSRERKINPRVDIRKFYERYKNEALDGVKPDRSYLPAMYSTSSCWTPCGVRRETRSAYSRAYLMGAYAPESFRNLMSLRPDVLHWMRVYSQGDTEAWDKSGIGLAVEKVWGPEVSARCSRRAVAREISEREMIDSERARFNFLQKGAAWLREYRSRPPDDGFERLAAQKRRLAAWIWACKAVAGQSQLSLVESGDVESGVDVSDIPLDLDYVPSVKAKPDVDKSYDIAPPIFRKYNEMDIELLENKYHPYRKLMEKAQQIWLFAELSRRSDPVFVDYYRFADGSEQGIVYNCSTGYNIRQYESYKKRFGEYRIVSGGDYGDCHAVATSEKALIMLAARIDNAIESREDFGRMFEAVEACKRLDAEKAEAAAKARERREFWRYWMIFVSLVEAEFGSVEKWHTFRRIQNLQLRWIFFSLVRQEIHKEFLRVVQPKLIFSALVCHVRRNGWDMTPLERLQILLIAGRLAFEKYWILFTAGLVVSLMTEKDPVWEDLSLMAEKLAEAEDAEAECEAEASLAEAGNEAEKYPAWVKFRPGVGVAA